MLAKKAAKFIAAMLFTSFLSLFVILLSVYDLTSYNTLKSLSKSQFAEQLKQLEETCRNFPTAEFDIQNKRISCSGIKDVETIIDSQIGQAYYKNYTCNVLDCIKQPASLASAHGNRLVADMLVISAALFSVFGIILFLLLERKIKGLGVSLIFVGINSVLLFFVKGAIPTTNIAAVDSLINSIFSQISWNFLLILIAGVILAAIGFYTKK